jgi:rubrerythrin
MLEFNADEVFEMAEQLERNGAKFYRRAAQLAKLEEHSRVLLELAAMEDAHELTFSDMRRRLADPQARPDVLQDLDNMSEHYLKAWADRSVFPTSEDPFEILKGGESMDTILTAAIGREKDAIVFFEGLKRSLKGEADRTRVDAIILEELDHIALLSHHRAALR